VELRQLEMFLTVVESGGYLKASESLHVAHSAIHRQVKILEHEIGSPLLIRIGRSVEPTQAGHVIASIARRIWQEIRDAQRQVSELNELQHGHLTIGTGSSVLVSFLPFVIQLFQTRFPGVEICLFTGTADQVIEDVSNGKLDVGIVFNPTDVRHQVPEIRHEFLYSEEFVWAVGRQHPMASRKRVLLSDLSEYPLIMHPQNSHVRRACERLFAARQFKPRVSMELENEEAIDKMVEINAGVALRPRRRPRNPKIRCFLIPGARILTKVALVYTIRGSTHRAMVEFAQICREATIPAQR
jgi:LysR family transcriptional regulator, transcription activator of glutamate synthase operon